MKIAILQATITDHPEYETFMSPHMTIESAINAAKILVQSEIDDLGEGEITITHLSDTSVVISDGVPLTTTNYFVTVEEVLD